MSKFFRLPFAISGTRVAVPDDSQVDGTVSYEDGYGPDYSLNSASNPSALNIERTKFNEIMYDVTDALRQYQVNGVPDFITTSDNDGVAFPYGIGARTRYNPGSGFLIYSSLVASNTALPSDASKWAVISNFSDGDKGDIVVSSSGSVWTIDNDAVTTVKILNANVTYAKIQNVSVTSRVIARKTAGAGSMEECTLSDVLDFIGSPAQGDILYRGSSTWARLAAGTSGQYLKTQGAGANPLWGTVATPVLYNYCTGLFPSGMSANTSTTVALTVSAGQASDSANSVLFSGGAFSWAITNGNAVNGYAGGSTLPNNSNIHFFAIASSTDTGWTGSFADTSLTPTLPPGYSGGKYRRIFSLKTNGSGAFKFNAPAIEIEGGGLIINLDTPVLDINTTTLGTAQTLFALGSVPTGVRMSPLYEVNTPTNSSSVILRSGDEVNVAPSAFAATGFITAPGADLMASTGTTDVAPIARDGALITDTSAQIGARANAASTALYLVIRGYKDFRRA